MQLRIATSFLLFLGLAAAAFPQAGFSGPGRYEISNIESGKPIGLDMNDRSSVIQLSNRNAQNVTWEIQPAPDGFYYIRSALSGGALEAAGNRNSIPVVVRPFNGSPGQQWRLEADSRGQVMIVSRIGKALDIPDGDRRDGIRINIYDPNGEGNQRFHLLPVTGVFGPPLGQGRGGTPGRRRGPRAGDNERVIRCQSSNGRRNVCVVDTSGGVRLVRELGGYCRQGETWGWDRRGIWVDRGCRAEFDVGGSGPGRRVEAAGAYTLTCSSDNGRRNYCGADTSGGVRMLRPLGGACREGSTWGWDRGGIWVDRGCRAEFEVGRR